MISIDNLRSGVLGFFQGATTQLFGIRALAAFLLAPILAGLTLMVVPAIGPALFMFNIPLGYATAFIFGIPAYLILRRILPQFWAFMLVGAGLGYAGLSWFYFVWRPLSEGIGFFDMGRRTWPAMGDLDLSLAMGTSTVAGLILWAIARPDRHPAPPLKFALLTFGIWAVAMLIATTLNYFTHIAFSPTTLCEKAILAKLQSPHRYQRLEASGLKSEASKHRVTVHFQYDPGDGLYRQETADCDFHTEANGWIRRPYEVERMSFR